jgi:hypothetical protein
VNDAVSSRRRRIVFSSASTCAATVSRRCDLYTVERYRDSRYWALYDGGELVCVTVYKKGANAVKECLEKLCALAEQARHGDDLGESTLVSRNTPLSAEM